MLAVFLLLLASVASVPPPSRPTPRYCRRCCDHLDPPLSPAPQAAANHMPEIRTIINMTILKVLFRTAALEEQTKKPKEKNTTFVDLFFCNVHSSPAVVKSITVQRDS
ncbi:hypothetical protein cypCar_00041333 [Cyprinus carpio]|nr:hypothetical protein cypCar_00041333 [Cyprinus carpio]